MWPKHLVELDSVYLIFLEPFSVMLKEKSRGAVAAGLAGRQVSAAPAEPQSYQIWAVEPGAVVSQGGAEL